MHDAAVPDRVTRSGVPPIRSRRLDLVSLSPAAIEALIDGRHADAETLLDVSMPDDFGAVAGGLLRMRLADLRAAPASQEWLLRVVALRATSRMVGLVGFHAPPNALGEVEIGYEILAADRRNGYALEAAEALMDWAHRLRHVNRFLASIASENDPSLALAARLGFRRTGSRWDPLDGSELVLRRILPAVPGAPSPG